MFEQCVDTTRLKFTCTCNSSSERFQSLQNFISKTHLDIEQVIDASDIAEVINETDFAISNGGVTALELCCAAVPFITVKTASNQARIIYHLGQAGATEVVHHSPFENNFKEELLTVLNLTMVKLEKSAVNKIGKSLVDGKGADRIAGYLLG